MSHVRKQQTGFTLVELLLAMSFVSILLMAIAMTVIQITAIYNKGVTMRAVGQVGQSVAADIRRSVASSQPLDVGTASEGGQDYRVMTRVGGDVTQPDGGRLCTGSYSYIWNTGAGMQSPVNSYTDNGDLIRLVKVPDNGGQYCADPSKSIDKAGATELLTGGDRELAVQSFAITQAATGADSGQALYLITMEIGTNDADTLDRQTSITSIDTSCKPPADGVKLDDYCAVNKFEFTARAGNVGGAQ